MDQFQDLLSFSWQGTKKGRWTRDKWGDIKNCRPLKDSATTANALLTGKKQLDKTGEYKLVALDLDHKDNWKEVIYKLKSMKLPPTFAVKSPSGGVHLYYWVNKSLPAKTITDDTHCRNFEVKGDNSNITAPGSRFISGEEYRILKDRPIAKLSLEQGLRLFIHKPYSKPIAPFWENKDPDISEVERKAYELDPHAKKNPRGFALKCPFHQDRRASAVLFENGYFYCSGCGHEERLVKRGDN